MRMLLGRRSHKGIFSIIIEAENVKATQLEGIGSAEATPLKGIKRVHSVPFYDTKSHQPLYSKEIFI